MESTAIQTYPHRTLFIIKPDGMLREWNGQPMRLEVRRRLELRGLVPIWSWNGEPSRERWLHHYMMHIGQPWFETELLRFMMSGPVEVIVYEGPNAVAVARELLGSTKAWEAATGTIRGDLHDPNETRIPANIAHASEDAEQAEREIYEVWAPELVRPIHSQIDQPRFQVWVAPNGQMMRRITAHSGAHDVYLRAIVHPREKDPSNLNLRRPLYDFFNEPDPSVRLNVRQHGTFDSNGDPLGEFIIMPGERWLCDIGIVPVVPFPYVIFLLPRSGLAVDGKILANTPGLIDADYRGIAGALLYNITGGPLVLQWRDRIAQMLVLPAVIPIWDLVPNYSDLEETVRSTGGFGSTGMRG